MRGIHMKKVKKILVVLFLFASTQFSFADSIAAPYTYVTKSKNGKYYFEMKPIQGDIMFAGRGTCYKIISGSKRQKLWNTGNWYAYTTYLSNNGRFLVRMGNWAIGSELSDTDLAVAFYKNGKLMKMYSTKELVHDASYVKYTVSHYFWEKGAAVFDADKSQLTLSTIDNRQYTFDINQDWSLLVTL